MLQPEEIEKIRTEETLRHEIRKSLGAGKINPIWAFVNSALGLWVLSTVVIGTFTFCFNAYNTCVKVEMERDSKIKQLDLEIESRISQFWVHLEPLTNHNDTSAFLKEGVSYDTVSFLWQAFKNPPSFNPKITTSIYKEFETRTTISLMVELSTLLQDKYEVSTKPLHVVSDNNEPIEIKPMKKEYALSYKEIKQIDEAAIFIGGNGIFYKSQQPSIQLIWNSFASEIISDRWNYYFPYTDCLFC